MKECIIVDNHNTDISYPYHEICIANVMLYNSSTKNNDPRLLGKDCLVVHGSDIRNNVDDQSWVLVRMKVDHVTQ